jgi:hypothetical protein
MGFIDMSQRRNHRLLYVAFRADLGPLKLHKLVDYAGRHLENGPMGGIEGTPAYLFELTK